MAVGNGLLLCVCGSVDEGRQPGRGLLALLVTLLALLAGALLALGSG